MTKMAVYKQKEELNEELTVYKIIVACLCFAIIAGIFTVVLTSGNVKEYNKNVCAVYGKAEDCQTPLK